MEPTHRVIAAGWRDLFLFDKPAALADNRLQKLIQRIAVIIRRKLRDTSKIADRLEMHAAHIRRPLNGKPDDVPDLLRIDARNNDRNKRHADSIPAALLDRPFFHFQHRAAPQFFIYGIVHAVKLHKYKRKSRIRQTLYKCFVLRQAQTVAV